jgi:hypothetical protein
MFVKPPESFGLATVFDPSKPYLYALVLPVLILVALGHRGPALVFALGAAALIALTFLA